jgi:hypothetical protein
VAIDRLTEIGATAPDKRDALAILGLICCGLDPQSYATSRKAMDLADRLGLDLARWHTVIGMLQRVGLVTTIRRGAKRRLAIVPPGSAPIGRPRAYASPESRVPDSV